jgi:hypothetical protein
MRKGIQEYKNEYKVNTKDIHLLKNSIKHKNTFFNEISDIILR